jgi:NADPH2:quinone reductase
VIGSTTSPEKVELARANGCAHVLNTREPGWEKKVREITGGKGVPVVYDSIGKDTFMAGWIACSRAASWSLTAMPRAR